MEKFNDSRGMETQRRRHLIIRKADKNDILAVSQIYEKIHDEEKNGKLTTGWLRDIYPTRKTAENAIERDDLFVADENGKILGSAIINHIQGNEYKDGSWKYEYDTEEILVMHTLVVNPEISHNGIGISFVNFYEEYARVSSCKALRIDTQAKNTSARALYKKCGFDEIGIVPCTFNGIPNVSLVLLEKQVPNQEL